MGDPRAPQVRGAVHWQVVPMREPTETGGVHEYLLLHVRDDEFGGALPVSREFASILTDGLVRDILLTAKQAAGPPPPAAAPAAAEEAR